MESGLLDQQAKYMEDLLSLIYLIVMNLSIIYIVTVMKQENILMMEWRKSMSMAKGRIIQHQLMHDFTCKKAEDMYYQVLREEVSYFKEDKGGQQAMCEIMDKLIKESQEQARLEGERIGEAKGKIEGEALGEIKIIRNYAKEKDITFFRSSDATSCF